MTHTDTRNCVAHAGRAKREATLTLSAKLVHLVMSHFLHAAAVGHPGVVVEGLERLAGAVRLGVGFAILAVGRGAGVAVLGVLPRGSQRAVRPAFLHFHHSLRAGFNIKRGRRRRWFSSRDSVKKQKNDISEKNEKKQTNMDYEKMYLMQTSRADFLKAVSLIRP